MPEHSEIHLSTGYHETEKRFKQTEMYPRTLPIRLLLSPVPRVTACIFRHQRSDPRAHFALRSARGQAGFVSGIRVSPARQYLKTLLQQVSSMAGRFRRDG